MKFAVFGILFAIVLTVGADEKRCGSSDDCESDECCIVRGLLGFRKGDCHKLSQEGEMCSTEEDRVRLIHGEQYFLNCPCTSGFTCEPTKVKELPFIGNVTLEQKCLTASV